jgi:hypothetical protein
MGQHMASLVVLPVEWTNTMKILQDKCEPTRYEDLETLFLKDMGMPIEDLFDSFNPIPIGVASLAQVHVGHHKASGKLVAVKVGSLRSSKSFLLILELAATSSPCRVLQHRHGDGRYNPRSVYPYLRNDHSRQL